MAVPVMAQAPSSGVNEGGTFNQQFAVGETVKYRKLIGGYAYPSSCLATAQTWVAELPRGVGIPNNIEPVYSDPFVGAIMLTTESEPGKNTGHAAQVIEYDSTMVKVRECNVPSGMCGTRVFDRTDERIRGYF